MSIGFEHGFGIAMLGAACALVAGCTHDFGAFDVQGSGALARVGPGGAEGGRSAGGRGGSLDSDGSSGSGGTSGGTGGVTTGDGGTTGSGGAGGARGTGGADGGVLGQGGTIGSDGGIGTDGATNTGGATPDAGAPSCDALFAAVPGYLLCVETATTCRFVQVATATTTCAALCPTYAGPCIDADNGDPGTCAVTDATSTCASALQSSLCVCEKR